MDQQIKILTEFPDLLVVWHNDWDEYGEEYGAVFDQNPEEDGEEIVDKLRTNYEEFLEKLRTGYPRDFKIRSIPDDTSVMFKNEIVLRDLLDILTQIFRYLEENIIPCSIEDIPFTVSEGTGIIRFDWKKKVIKVYYLYDAKFKKLTIPFGKMRKMA